MNKLKKICMRAFQKAMHLLIPVFPYREPEILNSTEDIADILKKNKISRVILVTDKGIRALGLTAPLERHLAEQNITCHVYDKTVANPTSENVEEALVLYRDKDCRGIIAFGGGSSMDCAKVLGARVVCPKKPLHKMAGLVKICKRIPLLIAVPTTAGTGSETTVASVIVDSATHHKYVINDFCLIPKYAVLDPKITVGLPPHLTATTGMDALTHAVEVYVGRSKTKGTKAASTEAVKLIFENLECAYNNRTDIKARGNMLRASYLAGTAFTKSYVGYVHAVAHTLGGKYGVAHGLANAVLLPHVLRAYGKNVHDSLSELAKSVGLVSEDATMTEAAEKFISHIEKMNERMNIPTKLDCIRREDIPAMSVLADKEANPLYPVPVLWDAEELEPLYLLAYDEGNDEKSIEDKIKEQKDFFVSGETLSHKARINALDRLDRAIEKYESEIYSALKTDLGKSETESFMCEVGLVRAEINWMRKNLRRLMKPTRKKTPLAQMVADSTVTSHPYGTVLIMSPWNYPILLTLEPLVDAIAAGNTAVVKPSAYSPATSSVVRRIITEALPPQWACVVEGGRKENRNLLNCHFDKIFFTGSKEVGKEVMRSAAEHLTPVALELGGKSPCIVDKTAKIDLAARRIVFGKFINCGQTCVAPDHIICDNAIRDRLVEAIKKEIVRQFGERPLENADYGKIITEKHYNRLVGLIDKEKVVIGGDSDPSTCRIAPTVMTNVTRDDAVMQEEIFGPILPILTYTDLSAALDEIESLPHPLALYCFTEDKKAVDLVMKKCRFGGGCINDCIIHLASSEMPFGGVGESGMGHYHGKYGFDEFSHKRGVVDKKTWIDLPPRYQPYTQKHLKAMRSAIK